MQDVTDQKVGPSRPKVVTGGHLSTSRRGGAPQLAEGRIGLAPSSVRQMMPGAQASATTVRATIAAIRRSPRPDARHSRPANDERGLRTQARSGGRSVWNLLPLIPRRSAATSAKIADVIVEFMNDDKGYVAWLAEHADGFVLNCERPPRPSYLTLHHASCWTISRTSGRNWTTNYQKVCADTFAEIHAWASQIGPLRSRGSCLPSRRSLRRVLTLLQRQVRCQGNLPVESTHSRRLAGAVARIP